MKKILLFIAFGIFLLTSCNQHLDPANVPAPVISSFNTKYPNAEKVEWEMDGDNYEAEFKLNNEKMAAEFRADGAFLKEE